MQRKLQKFLELKRAGKSFNEEVRKKKDYRNPDFLLHAVRYQDIDQIGSCFSKDVFNPHGFDKSDYYDEIGLSLSLSLEFAILQPVVVNFKTSRTNISIQKNEIDPMITSH